MDSQPNGFPFRGRPLHAVTHMAGDQEVIAGRKRDLSAVEEAEGGAPLHQQHPLIRLLVIPEFRRRRLTFCVRADVRDQDMAVRVEAEKIAEGLDDNDCAGNEILFVSDLLKEVPQRFPGAATQIMQKLSISFNVS